MKVLVSIFLLIWSLQSRADQGGVSFWVPGQVGSFTATPSEIGWSMPIYYYYASADAERTKNFQFGGNVTAGIDSQAGMLFIAPNYVFPNTYLGGQLSLNIAAALINMKVDADATLNLPGNTFSAGLSDKAGGLSDLYPTASLKWNHGLHNTMTYLAMNIPTGDYNEKSLANLGLGFYAVDLGGAYTYFDEKGGQEFSANLGFTYNFENTHTHYQNGIDSHLDLAAAQFFSEKWFLGLVGYYYYQLTGDSGSGALLGDYKSQVAGLGPQAGYFFEVHKASWYANLRGYYEFSAQNRPDGWNLWLTLAIPLSEKEKK